MSEDFGTVNYKRGDRAREIERLRQHYVHHRQALIALVADAPTEHLENAYRRLIHDIDVSLAKVAELEGRPNAGEIGDETIAASVPTPPVVPVPPVIPRREPVRNETGVTELGTGSRGAYDPEATQHDYIPPATTEAAGHGSGRMLMMVAAGVLVLAVIGWLIWRAGADRRATDRIIEAADRNTGTVAEATEDPAPAPRATEAAAPSSTTTAGSLTLSPRKTDYGVLRKGTRAVRQFTVRNRGTEPISVAIARSQCRCLYYEFNEKLAPGKSETVTVTIDGARAKAGTLQETLQLTAKEDPSIKASFDLTASIQ